MIQRAKAGATDEATQALIETTVRRPIGRDDLLYSCGAHLLGVRDAETVRVKNERDAVTIMDRFIATQLKAGFAAAPPARIESDNGKTLAVTTSDSEHYEDDRFMHDPFGYLRVKAR